ncbi:uncharacterized protein LOC116130460 [Pistacia vera]|uniref:uncharacterized protein LOC116130460 n=1 Tax=Pistacia vera TaxID=55513 RepID=UPI001263A6DC|nr:uncharacterized protein LOC116130460 [Pistacia vera]
MEDNKTTTTPLPLHLKLVKNDGKRKADGRSYRSLVGSLMYLTATMPDVIFSINLLSRFMQEPSEEPFAAAKSVLRYLKMKNAVANVEMKFSETDQRTDRCGKRKSVVATAARCGERKMLMTNIEPVVTSGMLQPAVPCQHLATSQMSQQSAQIDRKNSLSPLSNAEMPQHSASSSSITGSPSTPLIPFSKAPEHGKHTSVVSPLSNPKKGHPKTSFLSTQVIDDY